MMRKSRPETVAEFAEQWGSLVPKDSLETLRHNEAMVRAFVERFGGLPLDRVPAYAVAWAVKHHATKVRYLKTMFADAERLDLIDVSPFAGARAVQGPGRAGVIPPTEAQVLKAAAAAAPEFADVIVFCAFTGARLSGMAGLQAEDVRSETRAVLRGKRVGGRPIEYEVVLLGRAREVVARNRRDVGRVFSTGSGRAWQRWSVSKAWGPCAEAAGINDSFHILRHFAATRMLNRGLSDMDAASQLGHFDKYGRPSPEQVRRTYGHPDRESSLARVEEVG